MASIAFIGLGNMGRPMALNLIKKGHQLRVYDLMPKNLDELVAQGARGCKSAGEAALGADVVISMLPSSPHVEELYLGREGLLKTVKAGTLVIDCSTIAPDVSRKVAFEAQKLNIPMLDAPVSGGTAGAAAGTLTFIVGGSAEDFQKAKAYLEAMGKNIFHAGPHGNGQVAKICNNMLLAIHMIGSSEAIQLGVKNGIDPKTLCDIMKVSSGRNWSLELYNPYPGIMEGVPSSRNYSGGFGVNLMLKDLGLACEAATKSGAQIPLGKHSEELYKKHSEAGHGQLDFSSIIKSLN